MYIYVTWTVWDTKHVTVFEGQETFTINLGKHTTKQGKADHDSR